MCKDLHKVSDIYKVITKLYMQNVGVCTHCTVSDHCSFFGIQLVIGVKCWCTVSDHCSFFGIQLVIGAKCRCTVSDHCSFLEYSW